MYIKNNSKNEWDYNTGKWGIVHIGAEAVMDVRDDLGRLLIHRLGSEKWLTVISESEYKEATKPKKKKKEKPVVEAKPKKKSKKSKKK
jgi:hypothetical protein